jgi:hypothetical protein
MVNEIHLARGNNFVLDVEGYDVQHNEIILLFRKSQHL